MDRALLTTLVGVLTALLVVLVVVAAGRRRLERALEESRADVAALRAQVEALSEEVDRSRGAARAPSVVPQSQYLITTAGASTGTSTDVVPDRAVLSVTLGEPLVKLAAFAYGVRRALSPESRNRMVFEMRREVKRSRKQRRRAAKRAVREAAAQERAEAAA